MALIFRKQRINEASQVTQPFNELQDEIQTITRTLNSNPIVSGNFFSSVQLSTTPNLVRHSLGFEPNGWLAVNKTASFDIYEDTAASNPDRTQFIALRTSAGSYTLNLIIF